MLRQIIRPPVILEADNLIVARGQRVVLSGLSLKVEGGEALLLTGPNGAGKTTLIRTLAGFLRPESGSIRLEGGDPEREIAEQCHYVGHATGIKASLTAEENLRFWAEYLSGTTAAAERGELIDAALERFGLGALFDVPAGLMSAGQKRRLGLARLVVAKRPVWLLDEPTVSLDAASTAILAELIGEHLAGGGLVVAATHLPLGLEAPRYLRLGAGKAEAL